MTFEKLQDWSKHDDLGIRYYSGAATYSCRFQISNLKTPIFLDLGEVREVAEIKVNGKNLGILWKTPFRMDITGAVKTGQNTLEIEVVNLWVNRMIGDERMFPDDIEWIPRFMGEWNGFGMKRLPDWFADWDAGRGKRPTGRIVFSTTKFFSARDPLLPSGLIGPVRLLSD